MKNIKITKENIYDNSNKKKKKKEKLSEIKDKEIPIINTKLNNSKEIKENNMNKSNFIKKNNIKNNNSNIINNINNIPNYKEIYLLLAVEQFINQNFNLHQQKIKEDTIFFFKYFEQLYLFSKGFNKSLNDNSIFGILNLIKNQLTSFLKVLKEIDEKIYENYILMEYTIYNIKKYFQIYSPPNALNEQIIYNQEFLLCRQSIKETQDRYKILVRFCVEGLSYLIQFVEEMNKYCPTSFASVQNA